MTEATPTVSPDAPPARPGPPPLRIHHLLLCTVVVAIFLTEVHALRWSGTHWGNSDVDWLLITASRVVLAAGFTLALLCIYWRARGYETFSQPGAWLALLSLYTAVGFRFMSPIARFLAPDQLQPKSILLWNLNDLWLLPAIIVEVVSMWGVPSVIYWFAATRTADARPWRVLLLLSSICLLFQMTLEATGRLCFAMQLDGYSRLMRGLFSPGTTQWLFYYGPWVVGTLLLVVAMADDYLRDRRRYWTHWLGASISLVGRLLLIARILFA